jgi:GTP-binding protein HflX
MVLHPDRGEASLFMRASNAKLSEAVGLTAAINLEVAHKEIIKIKQIRPNAYFGKGTAERIAEKISETEVDVVIVDCQLSPVQQRNLEKIFNCKVIDRTALILEIFGERAQTKEGCLQVELAHLTYQKSRLVRSWTHLERQRGGSGFLGGPGETQIEIDRRIISERIAKLKKELEEVKRTRELHRKSRKKVPYPVVALVGYTNAGKSTLFNRLTKADVFAKDLLFATLDPTMRQIELPSGKKVILSDTVGFVSDLPTELVAAFRATLEEVLAADIIVHVRDVSHDDARAQKLDVEDVLKSLGVGNKVDEGLLEALNKVDLLTQEDFSFYEEKAQRNKNLITISALDGTGVDKLLASFDEELSKGYNNLKVKVGYAYGQELAWLYRTCQIVSKTEDEEGIIFDIKIADADMSRLEKHENIKKVS